MSEQTTSIRTCPDGHRCENGSTCVQHPTDEGKYYCDCDTGAGDLAGLFCEYEAETYCQLQQQTSSDWFCTNKGTCVFSTESSQSGGSQWDCDCPTNFEGPVSIASHRIVQCSVYHYECVHGDCLTTIRLYS